MKEHDIRPEHLLKRYLELTEQDAKTCFGEVPRQEIPCVGCGGNELRHAFDKNGFAYSQCAACGTLFQTPRPSAEAFESFYQDSVSSRYWAEEFFPAVAEARREKIFRARVDRLAHMCEERRIAVGTLIDVGAGYGIFLDEWRKRFPATRTVAIEPSASLARECRSKGFKVVESIVEKAKGCDGTADVTVCFEVLEHVVDPLAFIRVLGNLVRPGGYLFVSTLGVDGFDIRVLWEKSNSVSPPHHINFLSVEGFHRLFARAGFVDVDVTTPGVLDVDIVRNAVRGDPAILAGQRFLQQVLGNDVLAAAFQEFLSSQQLSSHTWVIARKPENAEA